MSDTHATQAAPEPPTPAEAAVLLERVQSEVRRVIVGQDRAIERLIVCLLAQGHCLLEGVPGLAKTLAAETLSRTVGGTFARIQFTPDLLPADVMGTRIFRASREEFDIELGPVFVNFLLADEINRAPAKVQSALLEVMAEHQVSIGGKTFPVPDPFLVLATQNPIESEGVYPLPEAQRDRFLMKVVVGYPTAGEEVDIVYRMGVDPPEAETVISLEELIGLQRAAKSVRVDRAVVDYAVTLVLATRYPDQLRAVRHRAPGHLRLLAPRQPRPRPRRPGPRPDARPRPPDAPGRVRRRPRRDAPPARPVLRGPRPGRHRRPGPGPGALDGARAPPGDGGRGRRPGRVRPRRGRAASRPRNPPPKPPAQPAAQPSAWPPAQGDERSA